MSIAPSNRNGHRKQWPRRAWMNSRTERRRFQGRRGGGSIHRMKRSIWLAALLLAIQGPVAAQSRNLDIYWIDVEGGAATLVVSPSGESLLYDAGWEVGDRDAKRIFAVAQQAGLKKIDYFVLSHFHADHAGGLQALAEADPDRTVLRSRRLHRAGESAVAGRLHRACAGRKRTIVNAGDKIPLKGVQVDVVASNGRLLAKPLTGGGPNPLCATAENKPPEGPGESVHGRDRSSPTASSRFLDLADLDWEKEMELACPVNRWGRSRIWQAGRHGALDGAGAPGFLYAIKPQVVIVNNGPRKGLGGASPGSPKAADHTLRTNRRRRRGSKASGRDTGRCSIRTTTPPKR